MLVKYWVKIMIDLHCHILPDVDDGAESIEVSCEMAAMAADSGVDTIVATPHCNTRDELKNYRSSGLDNHFLMLQDAFDFYNIPVRLLPGAEILVRDDMQTLLSERRFYTLNRSRYLLVEFYFDEHPEYMDRELARIAAAGLIPVVAHPERYFAANDDPDIIRHWHNCGYVIQINKGSVLGRFTDEAYETACELLKDRIADVIASDAHHFEYRTPDMTELMVWLEDHCHHDYTQLLLEQNPQRIIGNKSILRYSEGS